LWIQPEGFVLKPTNGPLLSFGYGELEELHVNFLIINQVVYDNDYLAEGSKYMFHEITFLSGAESFKLYTEAEIKHNPVTEAILRHTNFHFVLRKEMDSAEQYGDGSYYEGISRLVYRMERRPTNEELLDEYYRSVAFQRRVSAYPAADKRSCSQETTHLIQVDHLGITLFKKQERLLRADYAEMLDCYFTVDFIRCPKSGNPSMKELLSIGKLDFRLNGKRHAIFIPEGPDHSPHGLMNELERRMDGKFVSRGKGKHEFVADPDWSAGG
jgi:hypothetical protein